MSEAPPGRALVIVASNRAAAGVYADRSGPIIVERVRSWGLSCPEPAVVPDGPAVGVALRAGLADGVRLILTTGGTGVTPTDLTPEMTRPLLEREVPGIAEAIRAAGLAKGVPTAMISRGLAGTCGRTLIVNLPGSTGGVRDALDVLDPIVAHVLDQLAGGDH